MNILYKRTEMPHSEYFIPVTQNTFISEGSYLEEMQWSGKTSILHIKRDWKAFDNVPEKEDK